MIMGVALMLGACGNTITGIGKDVSSVGAKVTKWQESSSTKTPSKEEVKVVKETLAKVKGVDK